MMPRFGPEWRRNTAQSAGESVSAFSAEITIADEIVTANCRNSSPDRPGMKAIGMKTERSTSVIAMIGAVICVIASFAASGGDISGFSSMTRSTFSTTTIASSTTRPIATTIASNETVLAEKPSDVMIAKAPIRLTGTATVGMMVARTEPRKRNTTRTTRTNASASVFNTSCTVSRTKLVLS